MTHHSYLSIKTGGIRKPLLQISTKMWTQLEILATHSLYDVAQLMYYVMGNHFKENIDIKTKIWYIAMCARNRTKVPFGDILNMRSITIDKGKPLERVGRKIMGLRRKLRLPDCRGYLQYTVYLEAFMVPFFCGNTFAEYI
ncbi:hypothetical protein GGQ84_000411 [Desulfitispora alkaliphila]